MSTVKIASKLPKDWASNGLDNTELFTTLVREPHRQHLAVVILEVSKITKDIENADTVPTLRIAAIELVTQDDTGKLRSMVARANGERTGRLELPAEWETVLVDAASPRLPGTDPDGIDQ